MKVEFNVKITRKEMFSFLINNTYRKPMGIILFIFGIACFVIAGFTYEQMGAQSTLLLILLVYQNELKYEFDDKGITVSQGDSVTSKKWEECYKAADYGKLVVIYIMINNGIILPKSAIGEQYDDFKKLVTAHLPGRLR